jgi:hypothetical protein
MATLALDGGALWPSRLLRALGDAALVRWDVAATLAAAAASTPTAPPTELCVQPMAAVAAAVLVAIGVVVAALLACAAGALASWAATFWWLRRSPAPLRPLRPGASMPQDLQDLARIADFLELGGSAAVEEAAAQLGRTPASIRRWYAKWQAARMGPLGP